ncbi:MAG: hypothetical protein SAJ12_10495 [Jaaginema sp. PMC 1079.18]|nr:hypothetical protein [Jaaginema sp. PMC 1080.18]MEC4851430.1 hypothetical protein [Jaaginema sp. PMC 1079.18]MEC4866100.1 hypothetical protein [Jaaginema sp. PMC 1078.18]
MKVLKRSPGKFDIWHPDKRKELIHLDFCPFLSLPGVKSGLLLHFQAKPRGMREWGVYSIEEDCYYSRSHSQIEFIGELQQQLLGLDELRFKSNPTALCHFPNATLIFSPIENNNAIAIAPITIKEEIKSQWKPQSLSLN